VRVVWCGVCVCVYVCECVCECVCVCVSECECVCTGGRRGSNFNGYSTVIRMRLKTGTGGRLAANGTSLRQKLTSKSIQKVL